MNRKIEKRVLSVNVGFPREVLWRGKKVTTGIFKEPVAGIVNVRKMNLEGDRQADISVHGGYEKAVYVYPSEHYPYWQKKYNIGNLNWSAFGENITSEGVLESEIRIGDILSIGTCKLVVTQPRMPCFKLAIRFNRTDIVKHFKESLLTGFYCSVTREGTLIAGDVIKIIKRDRRELTVAMVADLYLSKDSDDKMLIKAIKHEGLPASWKEHFDKKLKEK